MYVSLRGGHIVFVLADLHLGFSVDKPMDVFGAVWDSHAIRIAENWTSCVSDGDTVFLPGDLSWAIDMAEALPDFQFLHSLPGHKVLLKGNHDYWWSTVGKMSGLLKSSGVDTIRFLHNNAWPVEGKVFCGTKGYLFDDDMSKEHNERMFNRERERLALSLQAGEKLKQQAGANMETVVLMHYPPVTSTQRNEHFIRLMQLHGVQRCYFGHLHGKGRNSAVVGQYEGIELAMVSADHVGFTPVRIE